MGVSKKNKGSSVRSGKRAAQKNQGVKALKCFPEVHDRFCNGWGVEAMIRFIKEERQELRDRSDNALRSMLTAYKKSIPVGDLVARKRPKAIEKAVAKVANGIDEISELEKLYLTQMGRLKIDLKTEKNLRKLLPSMTSEVKETRQILESLAQLKMDLGVHQRVPQEHSVSVEGEVEARLVGGEEQYSPQVKEVIESPEARRRVQGLVERFLKLGEGDRKELLVAKNSDSVPEEADAVESTETPT